jgi:hypothetical protein
MPYSVASDDIRIDLVWKQFMRASMMATGNVPRWIPHVWSGCSLVGNITTQFFYPLSLPFYFVRTELYYIFYKMLHMALSGFTMYCFVRVIGLRKTCAALAALLYMYGGFTAIEFQARVITWNVCWLPALFCAVEMLVRKRSPAWAMFTGLVAAVYFLGTHPQFFFYSALCAAIYFMVRIFTEERAGARLVALGGLACIVCVGSSAAGLFPALESAALSPRAGGLSFYDATSLSLPVRGLAQFFLPRWLGGNLTCYMGPVAFFLLVAALIGRQNRFTLFFFTVVLFSLLVALGKYTPLYQLLMRHMPGMDLFRVPMRVLLLFGFAVPVLCAFGMNTLIDAVRVPRAGEEFLSSSRVVLVLSMLCLACAVLMFSWGRPLLFAAARLFYESQPYSLPFATRRVELGLFMDDLGAAFSILFALAALSAEAQRAILGIAGGRAGLLSAVVLTAAAADLLVCSLPGFARIDPKLLYQSNELVRFLTGRGGTFRVLNMGGERILPQHLAVPHGIELADGYNPVVSRAYMEYTNAIGGLGWIGPMTKLPLSDLQVNQIRKPALLDLLNVRYLLSESRVDAPRFRVVREFHDITVYRQRKGIISLPRVYVYENDFCMPRAFLVSRALGCATVAKCFELLDTIDIRNELVVMGQGNAGFPTEGTVVITRREPDTIELDVTAEGPCHLFLSEVWYPGWVAYDNGRRVEICRANFLFRCLPIDAGRHEIVMRYRPASLRWGMAVSSATLLGVLAYLIVARVGRTRPGEDS